MELAFLSVCDFISIFIGFSINKVYFNLGITKTESQLITKIFLYLVIIK